MKNIKELKVELDQVERELSDKRAKVGELVLAGQDAGQVSREINQLEGRRDALREAVKLGEDQAIKEIDRETRKKAVDNFNRLVRYVDDNIPEVFQSFHELCELVKKVRRAEVEASEIDRKYAGLVDYPRSPKRDALGFFSSRLERMVNEYKGARPFMKSPEYEELGKRS